MKKIFTLIAIAMMAVGAQAQKIAFTEEDKAAKGTLDGKVFSNGDFAITVTDTDGKVELDANAQWFGTAETQEKSAGGRLKSGGKSSSKNNIVAKAPTAGTLKIWARTGSNSATDRNIVVTQEETELYNAIVEEALAVKVKGLDEADPEKETNVYPIISVEVKAGDVAITYPVGSMNFYAFEFVAGGSASVKSINTEVQSGAVYNMAGQQVNTQYKGLVIKNGKKMMNK